MDCHVIGRLTLVPNPLGIEPPQVQKSYRVIVNKQVLYSAEYTRVKARNSYTVQYLHQGSVKYGFILYFLSVSSMTYAAVKQLVTVLNISNYFNLPTDCMDKLHRSGIFPITNDVPVAFVPVNKIVGKAVFISFESLRYVCTLPNDLLYD